MRNASEVDADGWVEYDIVNLSGRPATAWVVAFALTYSDGTANRGGRNRTDAVAPEAWLAPGESRHTRERLTLRGTPSGWEAPAAADIWVEAAIFDDGSSVGEGGQVALLINARKEMKDAWDRVVAILTAAEKPGGGASEADVLDLRSRLAAERESLRGAAKSAASVTLDGLARRRARNEQLDETIRAALKTARWVSAGATAHLRGLEAEDSEELR